MPLNIDDTDNSAITGNPSNLRRVLNGFAFQIKALSGQASWKVPPHLPITQLGLKGDKGDKGDTGAQGIQGEKGDTGAQGIQGEKGDTGDTGAQGIQGEKGDKGDTGEPAPLEHQHAIADVSGLQTALDNKSPTGHQHAIAQVTELQAALDSKVLPHPGFVSGKYYSPTIYSSNVSTSFAVGYVYYTYFFIPFQQRFNKVGFTSSTNFAASQFARLAIYKVVSGLPSSLIADLGEISFTAAGFKEVSCSVNLSPGWYAIATMFFPNTISINYITLILTSLIGTANPSFSSPSGLRTPLAYGAFPSSAPLVGAADTAAALIWLKAA